MEVDGGGMSGDECDEAERSVDNGSKLVTTNESLIFCAVLGFP